jgi:glycosyltransferase involved in cell wall biosynthesis
MKGERPPDFCACGEGREKLRLLWIWHAAVVGEYQKPLAVLGHCPDLDVTLLTPRRWPERAGQMVRAERMEGPYRHIAACTLFTGFYYVYFFPSLLFHLLRLKPDVIYLYEEAHTLIGVMVLLMRRVFLRRSKVLLYAAQNIRKRYPPPFTMFERFCFRNTDGILACGTRVAETLRAKGYRGPLKVVALPTDTEAFSPNPERRVEQRTRWRLPGGAFAIGYAGKLVEEKGIRTLVSAFEDLARDDAQVHLVLAGGGALMGEVEERAKLAGLESRVHLLGVIHNSELPAFMNGLDAFVLPSETRPNWREQFGRVLVEAMSCGTPSVGSNSGEIPTVLGDAGLSFPEGNAEALASCLRLLISDPKLREGLGKRGRERALRLFATERVAAQHYRVYRDPES